MNFRYTCAQLMLLIFVLLPLKTLANGVDLELAIEYSTTGQHLDLCKPTGKIRKTAIVFIHGGGFTTGNRSDLLGYCKLFAQGGFTGVTIDYRLTSAGHAYPAAINDTKQSIDWMQENAKRLGFNPKKIVVLGYSAGATLALNTGLADGSNIAGIVSAAGISNFETIRASTPFENLRNDIDLYVGTAGFKLPSPIYQVSSGDPSVLIFHGINDQLVPVSQSLDLAQALNDNWVKHMLRVFDDVGHEILLPNKHLQQVLHELTAFLLAIDNKFVLSPVIEFILNEDASD